MKCAGDWYLKRDDVTAYRRYGRWRMYLVRCGHRPHPLCHEAECIQDYKLQPPTLLADAVFAAPQGEVHTCLRSLILWR